MCATRMAVSVVGICLSDVLFALDSIPAVLSLTTSPFILVSSQAMSLLQLRAIYFLIERVAAQIESMQHVLAVVLILIAAKIILEAAGVVVPITTFVAILVVWRVRRMHEPQRGVSPPCLHSHPASSPNLYRYLPRCWGWQCLG